MSVRSIEPAGTGALDHARARADLACAFRWAARLSLHEGVANHFSVAVSEDGTRFLMNPNGRHFSRIRASELLLLDANDPGTMSRPDAPDPTAWDLHGAIHRNVPGARCVLHLHPKHATVLATLADPRIPPIDQNTMRFYGRVAIDEHFGGMGLGEEAERASRAFDGKPVLLMGNHGVMVTGETIGGAFDEMFYFERACETLITAYATGRPLRVASDEVARRTARQWQEYPGLAEHHFDELRRILDDEEPDYRT